MENFVLRLLMIREFKQPRWRQQWECHLTINNIMPSHINVFFVTFLFCSVCNKTNVKWPNKNFMEKRWHITVNFVSFTNTAFTPTKINGLITVNQVLEKWNQHRKLKYCFLHRNQRNVTTSLIYTDVFNPQTSGSSFCWKQI